jgi:hypothetical protein
MNQRALGIITIFAGVLFVISLGFVILFGLKLSGANDQKSKEIAAALTAQSKDLSAVFQSERESTTTKYISDEVFGSFEFSYPKVWATNVKQEINASQELIFMADPNMIVLDKDVLGPYPALKVIVYRDKYASKLKDIENSNRNVKSPMTEVDANVSGIDGKRFTGTEVKSGKQFSYTILPLRDKTLYIGTDDLSIFSKSYETILGTFKISK